MNLSDIKSAAGYSNSQAFASKWMPQLNDNCKFLVEAFAASLAGTKSTKAIASYKSLVARFLVTNQLSSGKSGDSQKSALRAFLRFVEAQNISLG